MYCIGKTDPFFLKFDKIVRIKTPEEGLTKFSLSECIETQTAIWKDVKQKILIKFDQKNPNAPKELIYSSDKGNKDIILACVFRKTKPSELLVLTALPEVMKYLIKPLSYKISGYAIDKNFKVPEVNLCDLHNSGFRKLCTGGLKERTTIPWNGTICELQNAHVLTTTMGMNMIHFFDDKLNNITEFKIPINVNEDKFQGIHEGMSVIERCENLLIVLLFSEAKQVRIYGVINSELKLFKTTHLEFKPFQCIWISRVEALLIADIRGDSSRICAILGGPHTDPDSIQIDGMCVNFKVSSWCLRFDETGNEVGLLLSDGNSGRILSYDIVSN